MIADDDARLSPLWAGRRRPFEDFQTALGHLAGAYDLRDGRSTDPMTRVSLSVDDWHGQPITAARLFPVAAFDDLLFAVQQLGHRQFEVNRRTGWLDQANTDRRLAALARYEARGLDMSLARESLRARYADAARMNEQPDD